MRKLVVPVMILALLSCTSMGITAELPLQHPVSIANDSISDYASMVGFVGTIALGSKYPRHFAAAEALAILISGNRAKYYAFMLGPSIAYNMLASEDNPTLTNFLWNMGLLVAGTALAMNEYEKDLLSEAGEQQISLNLKDGKYCLSCRLMF